MRITCSNCGTSYEVPAEKIPEKGMKVRCAKCQLVFEVKRAEQKIEAVEQKLPEAPKAPEKAPEPRAPVQKPISRPIITPTYVSELEGAVDEFRRKKKVNTLAGIGVIVVVAAIAGFIIWQFGIKPSAPKAPPTTIEGLYNDAYDLFKKDTLDDYTAAIGKLAASLSLKPDFAKGFALLSMSQAMLAEKKHDATPLEGARANAKKALDMDENLTEARLAVAMIGIIESDYANAEKVLEAAGQSAPDDPLVSVVRGDLLYKEGKLDDALNALGEAIKRDPRIAKAQYLSALILKDKQDYAGALARVNEVLSISHSHSDAIQLKTELEALIAEQARGTEQEATPEQKTEQVAEQQAEQMPEQKAEQKVEQKPEQKAEQKPEQKQPEEQKPAVDEFQQNFDTAKNLFNKGRSSTALKYAEKAVQLNPKNCNAKTLLGWIYLDTGDAEASKEQFNAATRGCPEALYGLGVAYKEQGQTQSAIMYIQKFLDTNPKGELADEASRLLATLRGGQ